VTCCATGPSWRRAAVGLLVAVGDLLGLVNRRSHFRRPCPRRRSRPAGAGTVRSQPSVRFSTLTFAVSLEHRPGWIRIRTSLPPPEMRPCADGSPAVRRNERRERYRGSRKEHVGRKLSIGPSGYYSLGARAARASPIQGRPSSRQASGRCLAGSIYRGKDHEGGRSPSATDRRRVSLLGTARDSCPDGARVRPAGARVEMCPCESQALSAFCRRDPTRTVRVRVRARSC
jgi:hypothetical protein